MLEHPHKIPHVITVLMHDWEIHRQLMDVGFTYLNGMVALRKVRRNANRCVESLFLPEDTDDSNEELQPYFFCRGNGAGESVQCRCETVRDGGGYRGTNSGGVVQKFLSNSGLPSFRLSRPTIPTRGCRYRTQVRSNANNVPDCCRFQLS
mmetsp:Transcript_49553/g.49925  ORF Transcript_49553/g.49925 Transcript_49553/m.49925 type:complete len:150 (+) Transcript_49553:229-678(+)